MASPQAALELVPLARPLSARERTRLRATLGALLRFHRTLARWPRVVAPPATPIVAAYSRGELRGCALERGAGSGGEALARAFLAAAPRAPELAVEVFYARRMRWLRDVDDLEIGSEGVALVRPAQPPVLLMPRVARDHRVDAHGLLVLLAQKAGLSVDVARSLPRGWRLAAWTVESVVAREHEPKFPRARDVDYAAAWLARMVAPGGEVAFALDPRSRILQPRGELWHARSAIAIEALAAHGGYARIVARARAWLARDLARALAGRAVRQWPTDRATIAGTLALSCLAGVHVHEPLRALAARWRTLVDSPAWPWHAGQIACALGRDTPRDLWSACLADLDRQPFAPYTALAARTLGGYARVAGRLATAIRKRAPHAGGATATPLPETALTAVAAQALPDSLARTAALAFVRARQLLPDRIPAPLDPSLAAGAFSGTPIDDVLRSDITGHALLALLG